MKQSKDDIIKDLQRVNTQLRLDLKKQLTIPMQPVINGRFKRNKIVDCIMKNILPSLMVIAMYLLVGYFSWHQEPITKEVVNQAEVVCKGGNWSQITKGKIYCDDEGVYRVK